MNDININFNVLTLTCLAAAAFALVAAGLTDLGVTLIDLNFSSTSLRVL